MIFIKTAFFLTILTLMTFDQNNFAQTPPLETGVSQTLAKWRKANYSDVRYKLNITLEKGAPLMTGDIEIRVNLTDEGAKSDLILDWRTTQFANDKDKPFAEVVKVNESIVKETVPNGVFDYQTNKEHLIVSKKYLKTGENVLQIKFASPIKSSGAAVTRYIDKEDNAEYIYTLFVPSDASTAFPVFDQPDLKARFSLSVKAPQNWKVVSNSEYEILSPWLETDSTKSFKSQLKTVHQFKETKPISTYVFAFAAGDFEAFECRGRSCACPMSEAKTGVADKSTNDSDIRRCGQAQDLPLQNSPEQNSPEMKIYVRKSQAGKLKNANTGSAGIPACRERESANNTANKRTSEPNAALAGRDACAPIDEIFRLNREAIKFLEDWFDYKFPFPKYDLVLIPEFPFGGMEHAGATFLREDRVIFPTEPTKNDLVTRANVIFHEAAHQWFGDTVTMKWFDDLWLKEGFAEFMAYKTLEKVMPEYNAWKIFYERNKQAAYLTDVTRGTTPIYQEIPNLSSAKSAYGNIVYRKAPSFLKQAEFYLGEDKFQTAVRAFLKKHEFANAEWTDLVKEFETASKQELKEFSDAWVKQRGLWKIKMSETVDSNQGFVMTAKTEHSLDPNSEHSMKFKFFHLDENGTSSIQTYIIYPKKINIIYKIGNAKSKFIFPNYGDYGYGIFLLDEKSRAYVLENIQTEKDDFLRSMMWGSLWDSVRFYELAPEDYVKLVIKNINVETDESTIQSLLGRVSTAMNYYISEEKNATALKGGNATVRERVNDGKENTLPNGRVSARDELSAALEKLLINKIETAPTVGQKITYFRALQNIGSGEQTKQIFKDLLNGKSKLKNVELKTKDKFDLVTRLIILGDKDALKILADLEKTETGDAVQRYAYAARAGIPTAENKAKYWKDFTENKELSESWIEAAFGVWNSPRHAELTLPYLEKALAELPKLKKNRKIFFVNGWLSAFIGGQKSEQALNIVNKFISDNPDLDKDLRLKILENSDNLERAVKIRAKYGKN